VMGIKYEDDPAFREAASVVKQAFGSLPMPLGPDSLG
jgi:hypothetical protein